MKDYSYYIKDFTYEKGQEWFEDTKDYLKLHNKKLTNFEIETVVLTCDIIMDEYFEMECFNNEDIDFRKKIKEQFTEIICLCTIIVLSKIG